MSLQRELAAVAQRWERQRDADLRESRAEMDSRMQEYVSALAEAKRRAEEERQRRVELASVVERQAAELEELRASSRSDELADFFEKKSNDLTRELIGTRFALSQLWTGQVCERAAAKEAIRKLHVRGRKQQRRAASLSSSKVSDDGVVGDSPSASILIGGEEDDDAVEATKAGPVKENAGSRANAASSKKANADDEDWGASKSGEEEDEADAADMTALAAKRSAAPAWMRGVLTRAEIDGMCRQPLGKSFAPADLFVSAGAGDNDQVCAILSPEPLFSDGALERILGVALNVACSGGDMAVVQNLLHLGAPETGAPSLGSDSNGGEGMSQSGVRQDALHVACSAGHDSIVALFIERKVDIDALDGAGNSALALAARNGRVECVRHLMLAGAEPAKLVAEAFALSAAAAASSSASSSSSSAASTATSSSTTTTTTTTAKEGSVNPAMEALMDAELRFWNCCARGNKYYAGEKFEHALRIFDEAYQLSSAPSLILAASDVATIHYNRARSAVRCERFLTGLQACDDAIELQPDAVKTQRQRVECLVELHDFATAVRSLEGARKMRRLDAREIELLEQARVMNNRNHYETLGVEVFADPKVVKRAYRKLCVKWHPDKNQCKKDGSRAHRATLEFKRINEAFETLSDGCKRAMYDVKHDTFRSAHSYAHVRATGSASAHAAPASRSASFSAGDRGRAAPSAGSSAHSSYAFSSNARSSNAERHHSYAAPSSSSSSSTRGGVGEHAASSTYGSHPAVPPPYRAPAYDEYARRGGGFGGPPLSQRGNGASSTPYDDEVSHSEDDDGDLLDEDTESGGDDDYDGRDGGGGGGAANAQYDDLLASLLHDNELRDLLGSHMDNLDHLGGAGELDAELLERCRNVFAQQTR